MFVCHHCNQTFTAKFSTRRHIIKRHINKTSKRNMAVCSECKSPCGNFKSLGLHLEQTHGIQMDISVLEFPDLDQFYKWKQQEEIDTLSRYKSERAIKLKDGFIKHFICNRSGAYNSKSQNIRAPRIKGTCKTGNTCPAYINVCKKGENIKVTYSKVHTGHEIEAWFTRRRSNNIRMDSGPLILEVKKYPCLWDMSNDAYDDENERTQAWIRVATVLYSDFFNITELEQQVVVQEVMLKWRTVCENYIRSIQKPTETKRYFFKKQLSFLSDQIDLYSASNSIKLDETSIKDENGSGSFDVKNDTVQIDEKTNSDVEVEEITLDISGNVVDIKSHNFDSRNNTIYFNEHDEDVEFYNSTLPLVRTLSADQKTEFRIQVMQLLCNFNPEIRYKLPHEICK